MSASRRLERLLGASALLLGAGEAAAYSTPALYAADPMETGGGGGRAFTGAPADGLTCAVCHQGGEAPGFELLGGPGGPYELGATYAFELRWPGERVGLTVEASDLDGRPLGSLVAPPEPLLEAADRCTSGAAAYESVALADGRAPLAVGDCGASRLRLQWTAPREPIDGALTLSLVVADGDGLPDADRSATLEVQLEPPGAETRCGVTTQAQRGPLLWLLVVAAARRRRAALAGAAVVAVTAGLGGCARVQPYERGRLAQPDMQLEDDLDLRAGPDHALDYREGSAGGLGGDGGGCGCN
ncbi:MAG: DUF4266 domain-containing protein [Nannocystaceae bacterium]